MTTNNFRVRKGLTIAGETSGSSSFNNAATGSDLAYTLPTAQGASATVLTNDGTGTLSWALPGGGGSTFGNITIAVDTDNTISTTTGNLLLDSADDIIITGGIAPVVVTDPSPSVLTLASGQTTFSLNGGFGFDDSVLTLANSGFQWAHTAGMVPGSVNGTWSFNYDGTTNFPNYKLPYVSGAANTVLTNDGSGNVSWQLPGGGGSTFGNVTVGVATDNTISTTTGNLILDSVSGTITMNSNGTLGFTLVPITGYNPNADFTGNIVKGSIRAGAGEANGNVYEFIGSAFPSTGISIDNTDKLADRTAVVLRNYGGSLTGGLPRSTIIGENARGTPTTPVNIGISDNLIEVLGTGYTNTGWISDQVNAPPGLFRIRAAENFNNGINNVGTTFQVLLQPTATTLTTGGGSLIPTFVNNPQSTTIRSDSIFTSNKAGTTTTLLDNTGRLYVNGNITTLGTTTFNNELAVNATSELLDTNTTAGTTLAIQTNYRPSSGSSTYSVPQATNKLGNFRFNSYSDSTGSYALANQVSAYATENWTSSANGSGIQFFANKQGQSWTTGHTAVATFTPEGSSFNSDAFTFFNLANNTNLLVDVNGNLTIRGDLQINGNDIKASDGNTNITLTSNTLTTLAGDLRINGNDIQASDGNIAQTLVPITGYNPNSDFTGNIVKGSIRDSSVQANGDIWQSFGPSGQSTGISIDNTDKVADRTAIVMRNYGASLASAAPRNTIVGEAARGTAASPLNLNSGNSIIDVLGNGYTSTGWVADQVNSVPAVLRLATTEAWNNGINNVGSGLIFLAQPTATTLTSGGASLIQVLQANPQVNNSRSDQFTWSKGKTNNATMMTLADQSGKITMSIQQTRATTANDFAVSNFTTQRSADGINYTPTQVNDTLGSYKFNGNAYTGTSPGVPAGPGCQITVKATENWTSTANGARVEFYTIKTGTTNDFQFMSGSSDNLNFASTVTTFSDVNNNAVLTVNATNATFAQPVGFPVKTAAQWNAITGSVGQQVCVSDSGGGGNPNGMMAFWDTTNNRWSYIHDNSAV